MGVLNMYELDTTQPFKNWLQRKSTNMPNTQIGIASNNLRFVHPLAIFLRDTTPYSRLEIFHIFVQRTIDGVSEMLPNWAQLFVSYTVFQFETQFDPNTANTRPMTAHQGLRMLEVTEMFTPIWAWLMRNIGRISEAHQELLRHLVRYYPYGEGERRMHFSGISLDANDKITLYGGDFG